jgi:hypothetical protein
VTTAEAKKKETARFILWTTRRMDIIDGKI